MGCIEIETKGIPCCEFHRAGIKPTDSDLWSLQVGEHTNIAPGIARLTPNTCGNFCVMLCRAVTKIEAKYVYAGGN